MQLIGLVQQFDPGARADVWWYHGAPQVEPDPDGDWLIESAQLLLFVPGRAEFHLVRLSSSLIV